MDTELREQLLGLRARDQSKRQELVERGELHLGYHPEMEQVHRENARALAQVLDRRGWPRRSDVGDDGLEAAWLVAVHAIGEPEFQQRCLRLLGQAVEAGEAPAALRAVLIDRILYNQRRPQVYGTLLDWDEAGCLSPWPIDDPDRVEERRRAVGLPPLDRSVRAARERAAREGGRAPKPYAERQAEILAWARRSGWVAD